MSEGKTENVVSPKGNTSQITAREIGTISGIFPGEAQSLKKVVASVAKKEKTREAGHFIRKRLRSRGEVQEFIDNYALLKSLKFPVPRTVRRIEDTNDILITDLSEGGKNQVVSYNQLIIPPKSQKDTIRNIEEVREKLDAIVEKSQDHDILLSEDVYFLVVDKDGKADVVLGDLGSGVSSSSTYRNRVLIERHRQDSADRFYGRVLNWFNLVS